MKWAKNDITILRNIVHFVNHFNIEKKRSVC